MRPLFLLVSALQISGQQGPIRINPAASSNGSFVPIITTFAGTDWQYPTESLPAVDAPLGLVSGVAADANGNVYVADPGNNIVVRVGTDGVATVVAGNGLAGFSGDGGPATGASLYAPNGVAVDLAGNLYIADTGNNRVRKVSGGTIATVAGNGNTGFSGDGSAATTASLDHPCGVAIDSAGNLYIADTGNNRIREVSDGTITTVAGNGNQGFSGDGALATDASLDAPYGVAVDSAGSLYIADTGNNRIREVSDGTITTVAGNGYQGFSGYAGPAIGIQLAEPSGVAVDSGGNLYIAATGDLVILKMSGGTITKFAGNGGGEFFSGDGGPATSASLGLPRGVAVDSTGNLYIADTQNERIRKVSGETIMTIAGNGAYRFSGEGGRASSTSLNSPWGLALDAAGDLYIADTQNERIRKVSGGTITTIAGTGVFGLSSDGGPATGATLANPSGVTVDSVGNLYIANPSVEGIWMVSDGTITTIAGNNEAGFSGDGGPATAASLYLPFGVAVDMSGNLYIADTYNNRIRKVSAGTITTVAGNGVLGYSGDGGLATSASLYLPFGVAVDSTGNLYIADTGNNRVRKVSGGTIATVAGNGNTGFSGDGSAATTASLDHPYGVAVDSAGNLYIADTNNNRIRQVLAQPPVSSALTVSGRLTLTALSGGKPAGTTINAEATFGGIDTSLIPGVAFTAQVDRGSTWLSVSPQSGATPGLIVVQANPLNLTPGTYQGTITLSFPYANPLLQNVSVQFIVGAAVTPNLTVDHTHLSFTYSSTSAARRQTITVSNNGGGELPFNAAVTPAGQPANWLAVTPSSGTATPATPAVLTVQADPMLLPPGAYTGQITLSSAAGSATVTVTMTITTNPLVLLLSQTGLTFTTVENGGAIPPQTFAVLNLGSGTLNWSAQTSVLGAVNNWLSATPNSGTTVTASVIGAPVVTVSVNPAGLQPGVYYGLVTVTSPGAANTPQAVVVVLQVLPQGTDVAPIVQPNALTFSGAAGDSSPGSQTVQVYDPTGTNKSFRSGIVTVNGGNWLVTLPTDATIPANQPVQMVVQPLVNSLNPGTYPGTVTLQFSDGRVSTVGIQFIVTGGSGGAGTEALTAGKVKPLDASGVCTATRLLPSLLTLGTGFSLPAGYPQGLEAQVVDDCGAPQVDGTVFVQFNDGETPVKLQSLGNGLWDGTWPVGTQATSQVTLTVTAQNPAAIVGQSQINGALGAAAPPPVVMDQGVLSATALVPSVETPLAPGGLISIYGQQLSDGQSSAPANVALPPILAGTTVLIGSQAASAGGQFQSMPMIFANSGQVNAQVPFEVNVNTTQQLILQRDYTYAAPVYVDVAAAQPGIFQNNQQAVIYDANNNLIGPGNPAHAGDTIMIYCAGLGAVNSQPADGVAAPNAKSAVANPVSVNIGESSVPATSAGLLPGMVGVYQVTVAVPQGVPPGDGVQVSITVAGQVSPAAHLSVR